MEYTIKRGDTIAHVNKLMDMNWRTLKNTHPQAIGRSKGNGNYFLKEGAVISDKPAANFAKALQTAEKAKEGVGAKGSGTGQAATRTTKEQTHTLKAGETVWDLAVNTYHVKPEDIIKLNNIDDPRTLQIGRTLRIPGVDKSSGKEEVVASWYGEYHHGRPMANGAPFDMFAPTIAHRDMPLGTRVLLENPETGQKVTATVTDRGPYVKGRDVDLSYKLAQRLSLDKQGVGNLTMQIL